MAQGGIEPAGTAAIFRGVNQLALDSKGRLLSFKRKDVLESKFVPASPMPSYRNKLNDQELEDLVSFLVSVK